MGNLLTFTNLIIAFTCIVSYIAFENRSFFSKMMFWPYQIQRNGDQERWITGGFVHADFGHLLFNMITLFMFGNTIERYFQATFPMGQTFYLLFYLMAIVAAGAPDYFKHKNNPGYTAIGASGAVSAVLFASILYNPWQGIGLMFIPIPIPGFIFGFLYLAYSNWASKNANDNIGHSAHFFGAVFGFLVPIVMEPKLFLRFVQLLSDGF